MCEGLPAHCLVLPWLYSLAPQFPASPFIALSGNGPYPSSNGYTVPVVKWVIFHLQQGVTDHQRSAHALLSSMLVECAPYEGVQDSFSLLGCCCRLACKSGRVIRSVKPALRIIRKLRGNPSGHRGLTSRWRAWPSTSSPCPKCTSEGKVFNCVVLCVDRHSAYTVELWTLRRQRSSICIGVWHMQCAMKPTSAVDFRLA